MRTARNGSGSATTEQTHKKRDGFPRLLIRKHEKVSKINVFKGREHGTKSKNLILTGTKGADVKIGALFLSPRHRQPPYGVFSYPCLSPPENVSIRVRKPLFFPLRAPLKGRRGCFPMGSVWEAGQGLFCAKINTFQNQRKEAPDMAVFRRERAAWLHRVHHPGAAEGAGTDARAYPGKTYTGKSNTGEANVGCPYSGEPRPIKY